MLKFLSYMKTKMNWFENLYFKDKLRLNFEHKPLELDIKPFSYYSFIEYLLYYNSKSKP